MPIEVKELHIKVVVREDADTATFVGGDEMYRTQYGNNNAHGVDPTPLVTESDLVMPERDTDPRDGWAASSDPWAGGDIW